MAWPVITVISSTRNSALTYGEARRLVKTVDTNHAVSFRMTETGNPTFNWDQVLAYDFYGLRDVVDIWEPEAYGRIGDLEKVKPGRFERDYARLCDPAEAVRVGGNGRDSLGSCQHARERGSRCFRRSVVPQFLQNDGAVRRLMACFSGGIPADSGLTKRVISESSTRRHGPPILARDSRRRTEVSKSRRSAETKLPIAIDRDVTRVGFSAFTKTSKDEYWRAIDEGKTPKLDWQHRPGEGLAISNQLVRITFPRSAALGISKGREFFARQSNDWINVASWSPLFRIGLPNGDSVTNWTFGAEPATNHCQRRTRLNRRRRN